jgi:alanyl-tRNA synthetase
MQFNRKEDGTLEPLPKPSIDTGMGLERIAAVMQKVPSNYDTDLFAPLREKVVQMTGYRYGTDLEKDVSVKVIADHSRAAAFLIGDGVLPSNEGRGYVLRRVIRRALRHGRFLGIDRPFLSETAVSVMESMRDAYPELLESRSFITRVILNEEERFSDTLDNGLKLLQNEIRRLQDSGAREIPGALIFKLYDTYGFPIDIVTDMAKDLSLTVDEAAFNELMEKQREQSRIHWKGSGDREVSEAYRQMSIEGMKTRFVGYEAVRHESPIIGIVQAGKSVEEAHAGEEAEIIAQETPFYGESGGQVGDQGTITGPKGRFQVTDTLKLPGDFIVHVGKVTDGMIRLGDRAELQVDPDLRGDTALHHTATHILHAVLRQVVGDHVKQAGSLVAPDRLRFDFTHFSALTPEEIDRIEVLVNNEIRRNKDLTVHVMDLEEALKTGAMALFEEKYGDTVRMVEIPGFSRELCGGTHTHKTGDIGLFVITGETSVAAGVRRIEALAGRWALDYLKKQQKMLHNAAAILKAGPADLVDRVEKMIQQQKLTEKELESLKASLAGKQSVDLFGQAEEIGGVKVLVTRMQADNPKLLRDTYDCFKDRVQSGVIVLGAAQEDKVFLLVGVTKDLTGRIQAGSLIKEIVKEVGGSGGGRPDMAQAGGNQPAKLDDTLSLAKRLIKENL